jgi:hypothetical protein
MARRSAIAVVTLAVAAPGVMAASGPPPKLAIHELAPRTCGKGRLVVNVVQKVVNDVDSGTRGNFWAFDDYTRVITVWKIREQNFCTIVRYTGKFRTIAGASPGGTGMIGAGLKGHFDGGYRMDFRGTLRADAARRRMGSIGTFDYRCTASGECPGSVYWVTLYFSNVTGDDFDWWGWLYKARGNAGSWLNSIDGMKGDIVARPDTAGGHGKKKKK